MARRKWSGEAHFEVPEGMKNCIMTVCPGEPRQEGKAFLAIMRAAAEKLDSLIIIDAGDLGYHNFKRFIPPELALEAAKARSRNWHTLNQQHIDSTMGNRCVVVPMSELSKDPSYKERSDIIRGMYEAGDNEVTRWFDDSMDSNLANKRLRLEEKGVTVAPWAQKQSSLDYLCDEYSLRSLMWEKWGLHEIYLGRAVREADFFQRNNKDHLNLDLTIPVNHEIAVVDLTPAQRLLPRSQRLDAHEIKHAFG